MENRDDAAAGSGAASLEGIRVLAVDPVHLQTMTQTQEFSGDQTVEMVRRVVNGGACGFLTKPLGDDMNMMHNICHPVKEPSLNAAATAAPANTDPRCNHVVRQDGMSRKRPMEGDHYDKGGSDSRTAKKINFQWATQKDALLHKVSNNPLNGTEDNTQKNITELLEHDSVMATMDQVSSHLQKYKPDCQNDLLSTLPTASPSYSNDSWVNYSTSQDSEGSSGFNMRSQGATNLNQISRLSGSTSPVGLGVHANGSSTTGLGGAAVKGPTSSTSNGNENGNTNGYGYRYGSGNTNSYCNLNDNGYGYGYAAGNGGHGGVLADGIISSASLPSNLAQPVQQPIPTSKKFPSNMVCAMDNPNHTRQQELVPQLYRLSYDSRNGGISMSPWPQDDGANLLRRYQGENEFTGNTATIDMTHGIQNAATMDMPQGMQAAAIGETTKEMLGDGPANQTSAVQPHGIGSEFFNWESTTSETAGTSAGGVVTDDTLDWLTPDELENLMNTSWSEL